MVSPLVDSFPLALQVVDPALIVEAGCAHTFSL